VTRESELRERLRKAERAVFAARQMLARCPDEYADERASLILDVQEASNEFFAVQEEVEKHHRSRESSEVTQMHNDIAEMEKALAPAEKPPQITFTKLTPEEVTFKPIPIVARDPDFLAKADTSTKEIEDALAPEQEPLSPGQVAAEEKFRKIHGLPPVAEDPAVGVTSRVTIAKSAGVMSDEERQEAYRNSGPRSPILRYVDKMRATSRNVNSFLERFSEECQDLEGRFARLLKGEDE